MFVEQYEPIKKSLQETDRAFIALGCSFVQGQGAISENITEKYNWKLQQGRMILDATKTERETISREHNIPIHNGELDFTQQEYKNSFVNVLCDELLDNTWTPINFGMRGNGNRSTVKQLYYHPELQLEKVKEKIVLYCPSGMERFDLAQPMLTDHFGFVTMWPHYKSVDGDRKLLWEGYAKTIWSEYHEVMEQIYIAAELKTWCDLNNATLLIFPSFDERYTKKYFSDVLETQKKKYTNHPAIVNKLNMLLELFPWDNMITVNNCNTMAKVILKKMFNDSVDKNWSFFDWFGKGSSDGMITRCAHPSRIGHRYFAAKLLIELKERKILNGD